MKNKRKLHISLFKQTITLVLAFMLTTNALYANPEGGVVTSGNAVINQTPGNTQINQASDQAIINWHSFNIGAGEKTQFNQPSASSITLNRIDPGQGVSQIYGQLSANGRIILVNQAGIYFSPTARVDVASIIASTAGISDQNFLAGKYIFDQVSPYNGTIINQGTIIAANHGLVALVGANVSNEGRIEANLGNVVLASGNKFTVDLAGDGLIHFTVDAEATGAGRDQNGNTMHDGVHNSGIIKANGGKILMTAEAASGVVDHAINMRGVAVAHSVSSKHGTIILSGGKGAVRVSGKMSVSGRHAGEKAGNIKVLGKTIDIASTAKIKARGDAGGGEILIGGNYQGKGPEYNALNTTIANGAEINADAITTGDGGKVIVWSDGSTQFSGNISAQGGSQSGNGGFVETSGHYLDIAGSKVNLLAPQGLTGTWLLDPTDLVISTGTTTNVISSGSPTNTFTGDPSTTSSVLNVNDLVSALGSASVTVQTQLMGTGGGNGDITVSTPISWSSGNILSLNAYRNLTINSPISAPNGGVTLNSGSTAVTLNADITTGKTGSFSGITITKDLILGTNIALNAGAGDIYIGQTINGAYSLTLNSTGTTTLLKNIGNTTPLTTLTTNTGGTTLLGNNASTINITTTGTQNYGDALTYSGATITLNAGSSNINFASTINDHTLNINTTGNITFNGNASLQAITTQAGSTSNINANITTGTSAGGTGIQTYNGNIVLGNSITLTGTTLTLGTNSSNTLVNNGYNLTLSPRDGGTLNALMSGSGGLTFSGQSTATVFSLANTNTYTGPTTITRGILSISSENNLGGNPNSFNAGQLTLDGGTLQTTSALTIDDSNRGITLGSSGGTFDIVSGLTTISVPIIGSGSLTKKNSGTLLLTTANTYTGLTTIANFGGTIAVSANNALGTTDAGTTIGTSGNLDFQNVAYTTPEAITLGVDSSLQTSTGISSFTGNISIVGTGSRYLVVDGTELTLSGIISGPGTTDLWKIFPGTLILSGANTFSGGSTIAEGTVVANNNSALGTGDSSIWDGATLQINAGITINNNIIDLEGIGMGGIGALYGSGTGTSTFGGTITQATPSTIGSGSGNTFNLTGTTLTNGGFLTTFDANSGNINVSNVISGTGGITKTGSGTLTLNGNNTYSGLTTISAGTLAASHANAFGNVSSSTTVSSGATLNINGVALAAEPITLNSGTLTGSGTSSLSGAIVLGGNSTIQSNSGTLSILSGSTINNGGNLLTLAANSGNISVADVISGSGGLTKSGSGTLTLNGNNTYTGATTISAGTLAITANNALGTSAAGTTVTSGAILDLQNVTYSTLEGLTINGGTLKTSTGNSSFAGNISLSGNSTINSNGVLTLTGAINGASMLTLSGSGNILLSGALGNTTPLSGVTSTISNLTLGNNITTSGDQSYSGTVILNANPTLSINNTGNMSFTGAFTGNGYTLSLNSASNANTLTLQNANPANWNVNSLNTVTVGNIIGNGTLNAAGFGYLVGPTGSTLQTSTSSNNLYINGNGTGYIGNSFNFSGVSNIIGQNTTQVIFTVPASLNLDTNKATILSSNFVFNFSNILPANYSGNVTIQQSTTPAATTTTTPQVTSTETSAITGVIAQSTQLNSALTFTGAFNTQPQSIAVSNLSSGVTNTSSPLLLNGLTTITNSSLPVSPAVIVNDNLNFIMHNQSAQ